MPQTIAVVTDSTSDLPLSTAHQMGTRVVPLNVHFKGRTWEDQIELTTSDLFAGVAKGAELPHTSPPSSDLFAKTYERLLEEADGVLSLHISGHLSQTIEAARQSASRFGQRIAVVDTNLTSGGLALLVQRAADFARYATSLEDLRKEIEALLNHSNVCFTVETLDYLQKNGRIGGARAFLGKLFQVKPILGLESGRVAPLGQVRGSQNALNFIARNLENLHNQYSMLQAWYMYASDPEDVAPLREFGAELGVQEMGCSQIGAVIASHIGPGAYGFASLPVKVW